MTDTVNTAPIKWAQRADSLYVTISLADVKDETINLSDKELHFTGKSGDKDYAVNIEFFKPVNSKDSTYKVLPRSVQMHIVKEEAEDDDAEFWPRLLKDKLLEKNQVKIDWDRYVDEDDEEEEGGFDMSNLEGGMGMGGMPPGMGGMPGMGGPGGPGGMDMASLMQQMGGGGAGGGPPGGMDMDALMKQMGDMGGMPGGMGADGDDDDGDDDDDDDDDLPDLE